MSFTLLTLKKYVKLVTGLGYKCDINRVLKEFHNRLMMNIRESKQQKWVKCGSDSSIDRHCVDSNGIQ